jgi:anti-sigma-K factor RskA
MNHDPNDTHLENLLRGLAPAAASPALTQRVDEELKLDMSWLGSATKPRRETRWFASASWAAIGAAAAVAVMSFLPQPTSNTTLATTPAVLPVATIREWEDVQNDGIHYSAERLPEQHMTVISRERQTWIDPRDGAQMTVEYPRQQKLVLPVSFQ